MTAGCDGLDRRERGAPARRAHDAKALELEAGADGAADRGIVVDEQDDRAGGAAVLVIHARLTSQSRVTASIRSAKTVSRPAPQVIRSRAPSTARIVSRPSPPMTTSPGPPRGVDPVVAGAADELVGAGPADERVVAGVAGQRCRCRPRR